MAEPIQSLISPWMSDNNPHTFATMLKLIEECGELISRSARTLMAGFEELDPDSGRTNREEMNREISDVTATIIEGVKRLNLVIDTERVFNKQDGFKRWHNLIDEELAKKNERNNQT